MIALIESAPRDGKRLEPFCLASSREAEKAVADQALLDPERPEEQFQALQPEARTVPPRRPSGAPSDRGLARELRPVGHDEGPTASPAGSRRSAGSDPHPAALVGRRSGARGLVDTPARVARAWKEYCQGYDEDPAYHLSRQFEEVGGYDELVLLKDIPFQSHCEHHMAPITGKAAIAYMPRNKVVGISKLARVLHGYSRRLQIRERLTQKSPSASGTTSTRTAWRW